MLGDDPEFESPTHFHECCGGNPVFWLFLLIAVGLLVLGILAGVIWQRYDRERQNRQVVHDIYDALYQVGLVAAAARAGGTITAADRLREEITKRLGPMINFGGPLSKKLEALEKALKSASGDAKSAKEPAPLSILGGSVAVGPAAGPASAPTNGPIEAARLAIGAFNDYWNQRRDRIEELYGIQGALNRTAPMPFGRIFTQTVPKSYLDAAPRPKPTDETVVVTRQTK